jgi:hypothetical protein
MRNLSGDGSAPHLQLTCVQERKAGQSGSQREVLGRLGYLHVQPQRCCLRQARRARRQRAGLSILVPTPGGRRSARPDHRPQVSLCNIV